MLYTDIALFNLDSKPNALYSHSPIHPHVRKLIAALLTLPPTHNHNRRNVSCPRTLSHMTVKRGIEPVTIQLSVNYYHGCSWSGWRMQTSFSPWPGLVSDVSHKLKPKANQTSLNNHAVWNTLTWYWGRKQGEKGTVHPLIKGLYQLFSLFSLWFFMLLSAFKAFTSLLLLILLKVNEDPHSKWDQDLNVGSALKCRWAFTLAKKWTVRENKLQCKSNLPVWMCPKVQTNSVFFIVFFFIFNSHIFTTIRHT